MQWMVGEAKITRLVEAWMQIPLGDLLGGLPGSIIDTHRDWLAPHFIDEQNRYKLVFQAFVIEVGALRVVVDTCLGEHDGLAREIPDGLRGDFLESLAAVGYPRQSITHVLCTHMHFDHIGWNTMQVAGKWVPTFPNARYLFARPEFEHWSQAEGSPYTGTFNDAILPVIEAGLADMVECDFRLGDSIELIPTPGHSPGHVSVRIHSANKQALITGDATHHPIQWAELDWPMSADFDSERAAQSRRLLIERYAGNTLIIGTHYPEPVAGFLEVQDVGARFVPEPVIDSGEGLDVEQ